uniref:Uncharacterized protein n=1 Tax=Acrobeloides nanus TaxID=290746 RepID=A0A914CC55_9BILA
MAYNSRSLFYILSSIFKILDAFTCGTGCSSLTLGGTISQNIAEGLQCTNTTSNGTCLSTTSICNSATGYDSILYIEFIGTSDPQFIASGSSPYLSEFQCGNDNQWYFQESYPVQAVYCGMACDPTVGTCPSTNTLTPCPTPPPPSTTIITTQPSSTTQSATISCCLPGGIWSPWSDPSSCTDICGSYGQSTRIRICLSGSSCPCNGSSSITTNCNIQPCPYPRNSCCTPYKAMASNGQIICGPQPIDLVDTPVLLTTSSCPSGGTWSEWSSGSCNDTCGMCGTLTRTRTCISTSSGCPCSGSTTDNSQNCPAKVCGFPRNTCCPGFIRSFMNGTLVCA